jgi:hypothetical protein
MRIFRKPVQSKGYRNVFCPYYRNCLDHASKKHWEYWSCFSCRHKHLQESIADEFVSPANTDTSYSISPSVGGKIRNITI